MWLICQDEDGPFRVGSGVVGWSHQTCEAMLHPCWTWSGPNVDVGSKDNFTGPKNTTNFFFTFFRKNRKPLTRENSVKVCYL